MMSVPRNLHLPDLTLHTPGPGVSSGPGVFRLETVARAGRALKLIEQILQRAKEEAGQTGEKSEE